ncbi:RAxF-45 family protein [Bacillus sp. T33-2]|nr:RAxF-45 family protein [Bacillus sp. T33-2]PLR96079.1 hypothetical protein CVD19_12265 [Bacillus sp. T33-2]
MTQPVLAHGFWMEFLYICRAIFHVAAANGIRMPFFSNCILEPKR